MAIAALSSYRHSKTFADDVRTDVRKGVGGAIPVSYRGWKRAGAPSLADLEHQRRLAEDHVHGPELHVIVVGLGDPEATIRSLEEQTWPTWRVSISPQTPATHARSDDSRVAFGVEPDAALADGDRRDMVVVANAGDSFRPDAVFRIVDAAWSAPDTELVHWDDELAGSTDARVRPGWSPSMLRSANYLGRSFAARRGAILDTAVNPAGTDVEVWDLLLRLPLRTGSVRRLPELLSTIVRRPLAVPAGSGDVVTAALARAGVSARGAESPGRVQLVWSHEERSSVSVVIPTRHNRPLVGACLRSIAESGASDVQVVVVDNGERSADNEAWYETFDLDLVVEWWTTEPFNYSAVNNRGAELATGDVLVFLNDDTEVLEADWLDELVGLAELPETGVVGVQLLDPEGRIQHGGVIMGIRGFADHLFAAMRPGDESLVGPTTWYRDCSAVTGACLAVTREKFHRFGGFDERFQLCGSDVAFGLAALAEGLFNVVTPRHLVMHHESATRENWVPEEDLFASWWRYQRHVRAGDRWWSPALSLRTGAPTMKAPGEPAPSEWVGIALGREMQVFRQASDEEETHGLVAQTWIDEDRLGSMSASSAPMVDGMPSTINWWFPDIDSPFYGGINTALRIAAHLAAHHGVENRLVVWGRPDDRWIRSGIAAAFPALADVEIHFVDGSSAPEELAKIPDADASIASLWITAFMLAHHKGAGRRHYLVQDFEPMFYPAGSLYAATEETYRFGFHAICNTDNLREIVADTYGGTASSFWPSVDRNVFHAEGRRPLDHDGPTRIFVYARPGHWRNCWELARAALVKLKRTYGDGVEIVTAGSWAHADDVGTGIEHLGLLDVAETAALYRSCDVGVALTVSAHPSYLPLELMACGTPVVAFDNPAGYWILEHEVNSRLCRRTPSGLFDQLDAMVADPASRARMGAAGLATIDAHFSDWKATGDRVAAILADPLGTARSGPATGVADAFDN